MLPIPVALAFLFASPEAPTYALDTLPRLVAPKGPMVCPKVELKSYSGTHLRYHKPLRIFEGIETRLARMEEIAAEVASELYGRAPKRIVHIGAYNCRRIRKYPTLLSEHGMGNAIDIEGFDFGPASHNERERSPKSSLNRAFSVRIDRHWRSEDQEATGLSALHARFLRTLTDRLQEEDVFRVYLGPAYPGHQDHFHFDMAPYELTVL